MTRREFITLLGGAAAAWPLVARAQQTSKVAHLGMLLPSEGGVGGEREAITAGLQRLRKLGWTDGDNLRITYKWFAGMDFEVLRANATELVGTSPDVVWVVSNPALAALQRTTRTVPTVFVQVADPVGSGFVESLARPGGNTTGFTNFEDTMGSKWLELLHELAPGTTRALVLRHPENGRASRLLSYHRSRSTRVGGRADARRHTQRGRYRARNRLARGGAELRPDPAAASADGYQRGHDYRIGGPTPTASSLCIPLLRHLGRAAILRLRCHRTVAWLRGLCRPYPARRQAR